MPACCRAHPAPRKRLRHLSTCLVIDRRLGLWSGALSIASSWIRTPVLFVSSQKADQQDVAGLFWFVAPNVLCLVLFAPLAPRIRRVFPAGLTLPQYVHQHRGPARWTRPSAP